MRTYFPKALELKAEWHVLDASAQPLGRLAVEVARLLQGKHKPTYTPHMLSGDFVIVVNASKAVLTGKKAEQKVYYRFSGYPGGLRVMPFRTVAAKSPELIVRQAVKGMLPHHALAHRMLGRLKVYPGPEHPHLAQVTASKKE
ncbi:MAG: 50S ribosomal protein L13 [Chloroflexi bacterium]|nr:50S ribosomal protein L13 [Chloroflexota bacterium]